MVSDNFFLKILFTSCGAQEEHERISHRDVSSLTGDDQDSRELQCVGDVGDEFSECALRAAEWVLRAV